MIVPARFLAWSTLVVAAGGVCHAEGQIFKRKPKPPAYAQVQTPGNEISLEVPASWAVAYPGGAALAVLVSPTATVLIEQSILRQPLNPEDVDQLFIDLEVDDLRSLMPRADRFRSEVATLSGRRAARLDFMRPGRTAVEQVRVYALPMGKRLLRVFLVAHESTFPTVVPVFDRIVASLQLAPPTSD